MTSSLKIKLNKAKCLFCNDIIISEDVHHFVGCKCGNIFVDGGNDYLRRGWKQGPREESIEELSEYYDDDKQSVSN